MQQPAARNPQQQKAADSSVQPPADSKQT
eukprot:COSAG01_NODE_50423_length_363_cov_1.477273_1_plen_28_part_01